MLDLAYHDYADVLVVDDPDDPSSADDEEEGMRHVYVLGIWHRRTPDLLATACGVLYHSQFAPTRPGVLDDDSSLCRDCFTSFELYKARTATARRAK